MDLFSTDLGIWPGFGISWGGFETPKPPLGTPLIQDGLKLNGTYQLLVYADDVYMLVGSVHTVKENVGALVVASKGIRLEVNGDKTKHMVVSQDQTAGRSYGMKIDNSSFERVEEFKYLGTTRTKILFRNKLIAD
jgi:hypothetical protein